MTATCTQADAERRRAGDLPFDLRPGAADGAIGGHANAVADCRSDFRTLARVIAERAGVAGSAWR